MTDHVPRPKRTATRQERVAELQRLAREDYDSNVPLRAPNVREPLFGATADAVRDQLREPSTTSYDPLHEPGREPSGPFDLDVEIAVTRRILDETANLNIHDDGDMRRAAFALNARVRALLATLDAERGERQ